MHETLDMGTFCLGRSGHNMFRLGRSWHNGFRSGTSASVSTRDNFSFHLFQVYYNTKNCANIIVPLGFGQGGLHLSGSVTHTPFIFPPHGNEENIVFFSFAGVRNELTFDWFNQHVVCMAHSWICREIPLQKKKVFHQNEMRRRLLTDKRGHNTTTAKRNEFFDGFHQLSGTLNFIMG